MENFNEDELAEFLEFIRGEGKFRMMGSGIHTHPGYDENNDGIFAICEELEKRGLVVRTINKPGHVVFVSA